MTDTPSAGAGSPLDRLHAVQDVDLELAQLAHRRAALPERAELDQVLRTGKAAHDALTARRAERDALARAVKALDDEATTVAAKAQGVDDKLYSGKVTSPRELQDLQADLDQLRAQQRNIEDRELEQMELAESLDARVADAEGALAAMGRDVERLRSAVAASEHEIDAAIAVAHSELARRRSEVPEPLLTEYDRRRAVNDGVGAALLIGDTCQGCRLSIPATEVDEIRHDTEGRVFSCDNCGAILVPR